MPFNLSLCRRAWRVALACMLGLAGLDASFAGNLSATVFVKVRTGPDPVVTATCASETLSQQTGATVSVLCGSNQVVQIEANADATFLGTHGGAFRYVTTQRENALAQRGKTVALQGPGAVAASAWKSAALSNAVVTAMHVPPSAQSTHEAVEVLVSF